MTARSAEANRLFRRATQHHAAGRLAEAEQAYSDALARDPGHAESLHGLGVLAHQVGRSDIAIGYIGMAMRARPRQPRYHVTLGQALRAQGHAEEARAAFHVAVLLTPGDPFAQFGLAAALADLGRAEEALDAYRAAVRIAPGLAEAHANMGLLLHEAGRAAEAEASFRQLARLRPGDGTAQGGWAALLRELGRAAEAEAPARAAMRLDAGNADWPNLLGALLVDLGRPEEAEAPLRTALRLQPGHADARNNLGLALQSLGRLEEAAAELGAALTLQPDNAAIRNNLGTVLRDLGRTGEAEAAWRDVLARDPGNAAAHFNIGTALLARGEFAAGWPEFEWRDRVPGRPPRSFARPRWDGEALDGGTVLIHAEQGFGDTIQFCRYVPLAARRARIVLEVPPQLARLLSGLEGAAEVVARGEALPEFDAHCPMLSLPGLMGTTLDTIPSDIPYLHAPDGAAWAARLAGLERLRVGLCWAGSQAYSHDRWRSLPVDLLAGLAEAPGVALVSLQKDLPGPPPPALRLHDWTADLADFADTAALVAGLDLVVSVDTAVAHLAGALGRPVWLLNRFDADWRWLRGRDDSPWYPTLRQFRQPAPGDWQEVIRVVTAALAERAARP